MSFGFSLTVSVCPLSKWISVPFPFRVMYSIAFKLISWPDFLTLISRFSVAMFSSTRSHSSFLIWPRPPESLGSEREIGAVLLGGELRERSQSNITLGDEGLYPCIFRYRSPDAAFSSRIYGPFQPRIDEYVPWRECCDGCDAFLGYVYTTTQISHATCLRHELRSRVRSMASVCSGGYEIRYSFGQEGMLGSSFSWRQSPRGCSAQAHVRFVPVADIGQVSLYNLVCLYEYVRWNCKAETCRRLQVNNQFKSRRLLYRQVAGLLTF